MQMPNTAWRDATLPASFRGVPFKVANDSQTGGRRNVVFEFPKRDIPYTEDMGRRAKHWTITGYVIGDDYLDQMFALQAALDAGGAGTLQHPTLGTVQACVDTYTSTEEVQRGGICQFQMAFVEAGSLDGSGVSQNTAYNAQSAGSALGATSGQSLDNSTGQTLNSPGGIAPETYSI